MRFHIEVEGLPELERWLDEEARNTRKATAMAANKTAAKARTEMSRAIRERYNIKARDINARLRIRRARPDNLEAWLDPFKGSKRLSFNVIRMVTNKATAGRRGRHGRRNPLRVRVLRGGQSKPLRGAFIGNDGRTVFRRTGKARLPIEPVQTVGVPQAFKQPRIRNRVIDRIRRELPVEFDRAWRRLQR